MLCVDRGHQVTTKRFSLEKRNLFAAGPQKAAMRSPRMDVLKTVVLYLSILCRTNPPGFFEPFISLMVSPIIGQP